MLRLISLCTLVISQITSPAPAYPATGATSPVSIPVNQSIFMTTLNLPVQGNYSIGYVPVTIPTLLNSSACRRVSMFKFQAAATGTLMTMALNVLPESLKGISDIGETCDIRITLFRFTDKVQVGSQYLSRFTNAISQNREELKMLDVSLSRWALVNTFEYYFTIEAFTWNVQSTRCNIGLSWGSNPLSVGGAYSKFAIVLQQGAPDQPCGTTPWVTQNAIDGGYIRMRLTGIVSSLSQSQSPTPTPTSSATGTPSSSSTVSFYIVDSSSSDTSSPTATGTGSPSATASPTGTGTGSPSATASPSASPTTSNSPILTTNIAPPTVSPSATSNSLINSGDAIQTSQSPSISANIAGGISGSILIIGVGAGITAFVLNKKKQAMFGQPRSPVSSVVINNPARNLSAIYV